MTAAGLAVELKQAEEDRDHWRWIAAQNEAEFRRIGLERNASWETNQRLNRRIGELEHELRLAQGRENVLVNECPYREALVNALEGLEEMGSYLRDSYFWTKWGLGGYIERAKKLLERH